MIRPLTCLSLLLAGGSGLYLYQSKHQAQMLDREIERTMRATDVARDRIGVLRGEWALLNEPERLASLSQSHLGLKSLAPSQFVTAAELGARLPPPGEADAPSGEEEADALPLPPTVVASPTLVASPMPVRPAVAKTPPRVLAQTASALPPPRPVMLHQVLASVVSVSTSALVAGSIPKPVPARPAPSITASASPSPAPQRPSAAAPAGQSIGESVARVARLQVPSVTAPTAQFAYAPPAAAQPVQSALGGVRPLLPPPVPFGSAASIASAR